MARYSLRHACSSTSDTSTARSDDGELRCQPRRPELRDGEGSVEWGPVEHRIELVRRVASARAGETVMTGREWPVRPPSRVASARSSIHPVSMFLVRSPSDVFSSQSARESPHRLDGAEASRAGATQPTRARPRSATLNRAEREDRLQITAFRGGALARLAEPDATPSGVPVVIGFTSWQTNSLSGIRRSISQHWNATPGENIRSLCVIAEPLLVNLGIHLQWQDDRAAYALVPRWHG